MAPPNDGCSLFLRDLDELQKYARGRGRCQITNRRRAVGSVRPAPPRRNTTRKPMEKLVQIERMRGN